MLGGVLSSLVIGGIAGWLAGKLVRGRGLGVLRNVLTGILGAALASWLAPALGLRLGAEGSLFGAVVFATFGAVLLLLAIGLVTRD